MTGHLYSRNFTKHSMNKIILPGAHNTPSMLLFSVVYKDTCSVSVVVCPQHTAESGLNSGNEKAHVVVPTLCYQPEIIQMLWGKCAN